MHDRLFASNSLIDGKDESNKDKANMALSTSNGGVYKDGLAVTTFTFQDIADGKVTFKGMSESSDKIMGLSLERLDWLQC